MRELTEMQALVLAFIGDHRQEHQMPPTRAEIAKHFGFRSANAAEEHLKALERKGAIRLISGRSRGIFVNPAPHAELAASWK